MATNLETLERVMLRNALQEENPDKLKEIDAKLIEFASKGKITADDDK